MGIRHFLIDLPGIVYIAVFLACFAGAVIRARIYTKRDGYFESETAPTLSMILGVLGGVIFLMFTANKLPGVVEAVGFASVLSFFIPAMVIIITADSVWKRTFEIKKEQEALRKKEEEARKKYEEENRPG